MIVITRPPVEKPGQEPVQATVNADGTLTLTRIPPVPSKPVVPIRGGGIVV